MRPICIEGIAALRLMASSCGVGRCFRQGMVRGASALKSSCAPATIPVGPWQGTRGQFAGFPHGKRLPVVGSWLGFRPEID
jgi:hypothetical protein